jgi:hypothetical protein
MWNLDTIAEQIHNLLRKELKWFIIDTNLGIASSRKPLTILLDETITNLRQIDKDILAERLSNDFGPFNNQDLETNHKLSCKRILMLQSLTVSYHILRADNLSNEYQQKMNTIIEILQINNLWTI